MSFDMVSDKDNELVRISVRTKITTDLSFRLAEAALEESRVHRFRRILIDVREAEIQCSVVGQHQFMQALPKMGLTRRFAVAGLVKEGDDSHEFFLLMAQKYRFRIRFFQSHDEALAWLQRASEAPGQG